MARTAPDKLERLVPEMDRVFLAEFDVGHGSERVGVVREGEGGVFVSDGRHACEVREEVRATNVIRMGVGIDEVFDGGGSCVADCPLEFRCHCRGAVDYDDAVIAIGDEEEGLIGAVCNHVGAAAEVVDCVAGGVEGKASS